MLKWTLSILGGRHLFYGYFILRNLENLSAPLQSPEEARSEVSHLYYNDISRKTNWKEMSDSQL